MRKWGIIITAFYSAIVLVLLVPGALVLCVGKPSEWNISFRQFLEIYLGWAVWLPIVILVAGEALLLFVSVDTSHKRLKPRAHIAVSVAVTALLFALLSFAFFVSLDAGIYGEHGYLNFTTPVFLWLFLWLAWAVVFYFYYRRPAATVKGAVSWLLKGSVLELLVAVPCHVMVRRRDECSAPIVTSFGIATGIAIMILSFGPGVLLLCKRRMDLYAKARSN